MLWVYLTLLAVLLWCTSNVFDKYLLEKYVREPIIGLVTMSIIGLFFSAAVFLRNFVILPPIVLIISLLSGGVYAGSIYFYFKSLNFEEVSRVVPLYQLSVIFTAIFAALILGEFFTIGTYVGIGLLFAGGILISIKNNKKTTGKFEFSPAFWFMMGAAFLIAVFGIMQKYVLSYTDYWSLFAYARIGQFIFLLPIMYKYFAEFKRTIRTGGKRIAGFMTISEIMNSLGVLAITAATATGFISLVSALATTQTFFILLFAIAISVLRPSILKEVIDKHTIALKLSAIFLIFLGVYLIL